MERITSRANPLLVRLRRLLRDRAARREERLYVGDGVKLLEEAVRWAAPLDTVVVTDGVACPRLDASVRLVSVPEDVMASLSPMKAPQGALFTVRLPELTPPETLTGARYLVLDGLQDPGNVGTIWRTADAFGADGLLLTGGCADPFNWKTVRATMGAAFRLPVWELAQEAVAPLARNSELTLAATALREDTVSLERANLGRCAVVIGSEGSGVSPALLAACGETVRIPMTARCESLNAAAAAAVVLWELYRAEVLRHT